jgi:cytidylate kinase
VGRGASFILRELPGIFHVFLWAPEPVRIRTLMDRFGVTEANARRKMHETDSNRAAYIHQVYGRNWTDRESFDLTVNTARVGYDATAEIILRAVGAVAAMPAATA